MKRPLIFAVVLLGSSTPSPIDVNVSSYLCTIVFFLPVVSPW